MSLFKNIDETMLESFDSSSFKPISRVSLDELKIVEKIKETGEEKKFMACAIQLAVIGFTSGEYGETECDGEQFNVTEFFDNQEVFYGNDSGAKLDEDDITPKRIMRVYRFHIKKWLKDTGTITYLQRKYGTRETRKFKSSIFTGAEHLVEGDEIQPLLTCYENMDKKLHTTFEAKAKQVLAARGLIE